MTKSKMLKRVSAIALTSLLAAGAAQATSLRITVTNLASEGGMTLTPLYTSFHDGSFDAFDAGSAASAGVELIAEEGDPSGVSGERAAQAPTSQSTVVFGPAGFAGAPVIEPGEVAEAVIHGVDAANRYLSYISMVLPSNDTFIGNDDPMAYEIFDTMGGFLGTQTFTVFGSDIWDAGTEENTTTGAPFIPMNDPTQMDEGGVITAGQSLANFDGIMVANGQTIDASLFDFLSSPGTFQVAQIRVEAVPLPATLPLLAAGLGLLGWGANRRKNV